MAAGFQIAANTMPAGSNLLENPQSTTGTSVPAPRPTITVTSHPTITAAPTQVVQEGTTTVDVPVDNSGSNNAAAPVEQPAAQQPAPQQPAPQPPATNTGAS